MKMRRWPRGRKLSDHVRNDNIRVRLKISQRDTGKQDCSGLDNITRPRFEAKDTSEEILWRYKIQLKIQDKIYQKLYLK